MAELDYYERVRQDRDYNERLKQSRQRRQQQEEMLQAAAMAYMQQMMPPVPQVDRDLLDLESGYVPGVKAWAPPFVPMMADEYSGSIVEPTERDLQQAWVDKQRQLLAAGAPVLADATRSLGLPVLYSRAYGNPAEQIWRDQQPVISLGQGPYGPPPQMMPATPIPPAEPAPQLAPQPAPQLLPQPAPQPAAQPAPQPAPAPAPAQVAPENLTWQQRLSNFIGTPEYNSLVRAANIIANWGDMDRMKEIRAERQADIDKLIKSPEQLLKQQKDLLDLHMSQLNFDEARMTAMKKRAGIPADTYPYVNPITGQKNWAPTPGTDYYDKTVSSLSDELTVIEDAEQIFGSALMDLERVTDLIREKFFGTGKMTTVLDKISGTDAQDVKQYINSIQGNIGMTFITSFRKKYGSTHGNLNAEENRKFESLMGALSPQMTVAELQRTTENIIKLIYQYRMRQINVSLPYVIKLAQDNNLLNDPVLGTRYRTLMDRLTRTPMQYRGLPILSKQQAQRYASQGQLPQHIPLQQFYEAIYSR